MASKINKKIEFFPLEASVYINPIDLFVMKQNDEELPKPEIFENHIDLVKAVVRDYGQESSNTAILNALKHSETYKSWQKLMPYLRDVPNIQNYRKAHRHKYNDEDLNLEVLKHGMLLPTEQVLYRGGNYKEKHIDTKNKLISTSLSPSVARWHAFKKKSEIAILTIKQPVKGFVFKTTGNQVHTAEYEILLQNNLYLECKNEYIDSEIKIVEYDLFLKKI